MSKHNPEPPCPECEKLAACKERSAILSGFYDWLNSQKMIIGEWIDYDNAPAQWGRIRISPEQLFARYFEIDLKKVEKERQRLLEWINREQEESA